MKEVWKKIQGWRGYEVSSEGRVRSYRVRGHYRKLSNKAVLRALTEDKDGYLGVTLYDGKYSRPVTVHELVLEAFVSKRPIGKEGRHLDGNPSNNSIRNLAWATHLVNEQDKKVHGTRPEGLRNWLAIDLSKRDVKEILDRCKRGETQDSVAASFGISQSLVSQIKRGISWHTRR